MQVRKAVTIVFCDLVGSTSLGETVDSEALREIMSTYFQEMREAIEEHGGTVEKFIGDGILAVFGVPRVHEDDALRAVTAAVAMRRRLEVLNRDLEHRWGVSLANRTGVNTGELVAGEAVAGHGLLIGDPVNVAARLEQAAPTNEILIGEPTFELLRDHVEVEKVEPLALKGKADLVPAYRLIRLTDGEVLVRHHDRPMVGRREELELLRSALRVPPRVGRRLATVVGARGRGQVPPHRGIRAIDRGQGAGPARTVPDVWPRHHLLAAGRDRSPSRLDRRGRPSGGGLAKLASLAGDGAVAERVASVAGARAERQFSVEEIRWATRKLLERLAGERPLVVVFDDIHWAEPTLVDLIQHVADSAEALAAGALPGPQRSARAPPRLAARGRGAADLPRATLRTRPWERIVDNILGRGDAGAQVRARILEAAAGNPLFVEQMLTMLMEERNPSPRGRAVAADDPAFGRHCAADDSGIAHRAHRTARARRACRDRRPHRSPASASPSAPSNRSRMNRSLPS